MGDEATKEAMDEFRRRYNAVVDAIELTGIHLMRVQAALSPGGLAPLGEPQALSVDPICAEASIAVENPRTLQIGCTLGFGVTQRADEAPDAEPVLRVTAEYGVFYRLPAWVECDEVIAWCLSAHTGAMNAWPYFRELVVSVGCRMGLPELVVPLLRLPNRIPKPG